MEAIEHDIPARNTRQALKRGFRMRCPKCGEGKVLHSYLKVNERCEACDLDLTHARADDGPAYVTILIVGHLAGFAMHLMWSIWQPSALTMALTVSVGVIVLSLALLPRFKGAMIGLQWAKRLHGF
ncbi:DUF983 domain-containing protein [Dinoroseobacter sp. S124A]|uniref:DUF983 domain-containing protein n=1 Tax=Dinoroseobacter sp. S124A TaxID=3415128 RepID=UPI003C7C6826